MTKPQEDITQFQQGDVITFQSSKGTIITHRIQEAKQGGEQYVTKEDNNNAVDTELAQAKKVVGQYTGFTVQYVGYIVLRQKAHFFC
ncbi:signal peptidase I [Virgibacillus oceani]